MFEKSVRGWNSIPAKSWRSWHGVVGTKVQDLRLVLLSLLLGRWQIHTRDLLCTQGRLRAAISFTWMEIKEEKYIVLLLDCFDSFFPECIFAFWLP